MLREPAAPELRRGERCRLVQRAGKHLNRVMDVVRVGEGDEAGWRGGRPAPPSRAAEVAGRTSMNT
jgi:hypothetical protein